MDFTSKYIAKEPNAKGIIDYDATENDTWKFLYHRQMDVVQNRACNTFLKGLEILDLPSDRIPQCRDLNKALGATTGWSVQPVAALISAKQFFTLLSERKFPAATFIRHPDEMDYLQEPDLFHEYFGHCPLLTDQNYANFAEEYGKLCLKVSDEERELLARLYWFTVEFGLINTSKGIRCYGGGILSSKEETIYAIDSDKPIRQAFDTLTAFRTPYRINILQPIYFVIDTIEQLYNSITTDIHSTMKKAQQLGEFEPLFEAEEESH